MTLTLLVSGGFEKKENKNKQKKTKTNQTNKENILGCPWDLRVVLELEPLMCSIVESQRDLAMHLQGFLQTV